MSLHIPDIVSFSLAIRAKVFQGWEGSVEMMAKQIMDKSDRCIKPGDITFSACCNAWCFCFFVCLS